MDSLAQPKIRARSFTPPLGPPSEDSSTPMTISSSMDFSIMNSQAILTIVWVFLLIIFLILPTCSSKRKRKIWRLRFKERRWNVYVEEEEEDWFVVALARYREAVAREEANRRANGGNDSRQSADVAWKEKEEPILRRALTDNLLGNFTMTLDKSNFIEIVPDSPEEDGPPSTDKISDEEKEGEKMKEEEHVIVTKTDSILEGAYRVQLPPPGISKEDSSDHENSSNNEGSDGTTEGNSREVPNGCAICMDPFHPDDRACWSSNEYCPHVYHEKCIVNWLIVLGRRHRMQELRSAPRSTEEEQESEVVNLTNFNMLCPCCRQDFVSSSVKERETSPQDVSDAV